jgi:esterase/lipase
MRGHGRSDYPDDPSEYSEKATVEDIAALLGAVGTKKAIVGGLSLGGYMSLAFYSAYPDRVTALLIIDTGPGFRNDEAREAWNKNALATASKLEAEGLSLLKSTSPERATSEHRSSRGLVNAARGMLTQRNANVINSLPGIAVPSLVIVGANDTPFLNAADYMAKRIPGAQKMVIPGAATRPILISPGSSTKPCWIFCGGHARRFVPCSAHHEINDLSSIACCLRRKARQYARGTPRLMFAPSKSVGYGSISTPGLSKACGSKVAFAAFSAAANNGGRWRSYQGRWSRPTA